ncbi:hypothetical protein D9Q98_007995 [Chlorella vulgaris]|uniref:Ysc84 actin-binding domain-containing protein n=1 Tax=Chlorella vulgaris TaxID=3077 RepID=A0A9D4TI09_CHLVU|nr:hypothetical protein D9Q98_007995 [Chlorella vulgaris]
MSVSHNKRSVALSFKEIQELLAEAANATDQHAEAGPGSHRSDTGGGGTSGTVTPAISRPTSLVLQKQPSLVMHRRAGKLGGPWVPDPGTAAAWLPGASVERPPLVQRRLEKRCRKALQLLDQLQQPVFNLAKGGNVAPLPPAALRFCKGLVFIEQRKAGVVAGWEWGNGVVCRRFPDGSWSPPCFIKLRGASLGFTFGMHTIKSCHVLQNMEQVMAFVQEQGACTIDCTVPSSGLDPLAPEAAVKPLRHIAIPLEPGVEPPHSVQLAEGLIYDLSVRLGMSYTDDGLNAAAYGEGATAEQILCGEVAPPAEFLPLVQALLRMAAEATVVRRTVSKFELARQASRMSSSGRSTSNGNRPALHRSSSEVGFGTCTSHDSFLAGGSPHSVLSQGGTPEPGPHGSPRAFKLFDVGCDMVEECGSDNPQADEVQQLDAQQQPHQQQQQQLAGQNLPDHQQAANSRQQRSRGVAAAEGTPPPSYPAMPAAAVAVASSVTQR